MARLARDVMEKHVITVSPDDPIRNVQRLFVEEGIHGAPVVDEVGQLVGVVSSLDLLRSATDGREMLEPDPRDLRGLLDLDSRTWADEGAGLADMEQEAGRVDEPTVADVMTGAPVAAVEPTTPIAGVARVLRESQVHRVVVVDGSRVCGIISSFDLLRVLEEGDAP